MTTLRRQERDHGVYQRASWEGEGGGRGAYARTTLPEPRTVCGAYRNEQADYTVKGTRAATNLFLFSRVSLGALAPAAV